MAIISNAVTIADAGAFSASLGSMVHIKTITLSSAAANITFIHGTSSVVFNDTYPIYVIQLDNIRTAGGNVQWQTTTDGSNFNVVATNTANVAEHSENDSSVARIAYSAGYDVAQGASPFLFNINKGGIDTGTDASGSGTITMFNPSSTTFCKHYLARINSMSEYPGSTDNFTAGYFNTTSALTGFRIKEVNGNNILSGSMKLFGIKDS